MAVGHAGLRRNREPKNGSTSSAIRATARPGQHSPRNPTPFREVLAKASPRPGRSAAAQDGTRSRQAARASWPWPVFATNRREHFPGLKFASLLVGMMIGGGAACSSRQLTRIDSINTVAVAGVMFYLPSLVLWFMRNRQGQHLLWLADVPRPAGRVRRSRVGPGPGDAQGERGDEEKLAARWPRNSGCATSNCRWAARAPKSARVWLAHGCRRPAQLAAILDPGRQVRLEHCPGLARAERLDADPAAANWPKKRRPKRP